MARFKNAELEKSKFEVANMEARERRDQADIRYCASLFLTLHRCKLCSHLNVDGYVCVHCGGDDSNV